MKRLLLVLALAPAAAAEDGPDNALATFGARAWRLHERLAKDRTLAEKDDVVRELQEVAVGFARAVTARYPKLLNPACHEFRFPASAAPADRAKALEIVRARLAGWGAADARVVTHGGDRVYVLLNDADERAVGEDLAAVAWPGPIEFRLEADEADVKAWKESGKAPEGTEALETGGEPILLRRAAALDGRHVAAAETVVDAGQTEIRLTMTAEGAREMTAVTEKNIGRRLGIVAGSRVLSAPVIRATIGRDVTVTGRFSKEEAARLVTAFKAGILPCRLEAGASSGGLILQNDEEPWKSEPVAQFPERMLQNNLIHAVLEDALRQNDPQAWDQIVKFLEARAK